MIRLYGMRDTEILVAVGQILFFLRQSDAHFPKPGTEIHLVTGTIYVKITPEELIKKLEEKVSLISLLTFDNRPIWVNRDHIQQVSSKSLLGGPGTELLIGGRSQYVISQYDNVCRLLGDIV